MARLTKTLFVALGLAREVMGHGAIQYSEADGVRLAGYYSRVEGHPDKYDTSLGNNWLTPKQIKRFTYISPEQYSTPDVICHLGATNAPGYLTVKAGDDVTLQWTDWPFSHHGPMIDYLSNCNGDCTTVDKTKLKFHKIAESGLLDPDHKLFDKNFKQTSGYWASDEFREADSRWTVKIPATIAPGMYVLRQEAIALHSSMEEIVNGTQNYPQCFNLKITGSGTDNLAGGTPGMELYTGLEPGLHDLNIFANDGGLRNYTIPGPPLHVFESSASGLVSSNTTASINSNTTASVNSNVTVPVVSMMSKVTARPSASPVRIPLPSGRYLNHTMSANATAACKGASASACIPTAKPGGTGAPYPYTNSSSPGGAAGTAVSTVTLTTTVEACPTDLSASQMGAGDAGYLKVRRADLDAFRAHFDQATEKFMMIMEGSPAT